MKAFGSWTFHHVLVSCAVVFLSGCGDSSNEKPATPSTPTATAPATNAAPAPISTQPSASAPLTPEEAKSHIGENATVRGKVFRVNQSKKGDIFLDIGGKYPDAPFTAVCFKEAIPLQQLKAFEGKTVSITGKIKEYNGRVEIILDSLEQITE